MNRVFIIGGGTSVNDIDLSLLKDENTIVVNKAIFDVPNPTCFITMDYSFLGKIDIDKLQDTECHKVFVANTLPDYIVETNIGLKDARNNTQYIIKGFNEEIRSNSYRYFGTYHEKFSSGKNSGFCAIQYALLCGFDEIYLLGFDYTCKDNLTHYHGGYDQNSRQFQFKLDEYFTYLREAIETYRGNTKFFSCSKDAKVNCLMPYKDLKEVI